MGVIKRQAIQGTFFSYIGVVLGFIAQGILMPKVLTKDQNGLLGLLIPGSIVLSQIANLGLNNAGNRFFTYFRNYERQHNGYLLVSSLVSLGGFLFCVVLLLTLRPLIVERYSEGSSLFVQYYYLLIPLTFFTLYFNLFDTYAKLLYDTVTGTMLQQFVQRLFVLLAAVCYGLDWVSFEVFLGLWLLAFIVPTVLIIGKVARDRALVFSRRYVQVNSDMRRQIARYAALTLLTGLSSQVILHIDKYMVNDFLGLAKAGVYSICSYFGTVIALPAMALYKVSGVIIADAWKNNDLASIQNIYRKSCLSQLIIGCLVFVGIAANLPNVFYILPKGYEAGYFVILWIGLGKLIDMATGVNGMILATSRYYAYDSLFFLVLVVLTFVITRYLLPIYELEGAAIGAAIATALFNGARTWFVWYKFGLQPFSWRNAAVLVVAGLVWVIAMQYPHRLTSPVTVALDIVLRSGFITLAFVGVVYALRLSPDLNQLMLGLPARFFRPKPQS